MPLDPDCCELLRAAVRPAETDSAQISQLARAVRDWDLVLHLADEHRVLPILYLRLTSLDSAVPPDVLERLAERYQRNMFHNLANAAELIALLKAFEHETITAMPFKGIVLGASAYGDLTTRPAGDIDLLIHEVNLEQVTSIIKARGYELKTEAQADGSPFQDCYEYHFERESDGSVLEVRWRLVLTQPRFRHVLDMDWVWPRRRTAIVAGAEVPNIDPERNLLMLCMHGSKHVWSRLIWICDVAQLLTSSPELDWRETIEEAKRTGLWRSLALGVLLAHRVTGTDVPRDVLLRFRADTTARHLAEYIAENLLEAPGSAPEGRVPYYVKLLGFHDRVRLLLSMDYLRPNEHDRAVLPLHKSLSPLYFLVRPFRLFRDRSAR
jgi:Uncharacterised nucleotidyltransferase